MSGTAGGSGIILRGIEPETAKSVVSLSEQMIAGTIDDLTFDRDERLPPIILGTQLANDLRVSVGGKVRLISPSGPLTPMGVIPKIKTCRVAGIFESGMYEYDSSLAYMHIHAVQEFLEIGDVAHGIEVPVDKELLNKADEIAQAIVAKARSRHHRPRLDVDEPQPVRGFQTGENRHVHLRGPDHSGGSTEYHQCPDHAGHGEGP